MGSLRRSVDSVSETLTQSSFFDSDDELSDQHSLHSTPHRKNFRPSLFSATALDAAEPFGTSAEPVLTGMDATAADIPLFARDLYERYSDYPGPTVDEKGIAFKISVEDFVFRPDAITVEQGSAVQFTYHGSVSVQKLCCDDEFDSVGLDGDQLAIFVHTFLTPGTFTVVNEVFSFMSCRITVTKSSHPMHDKTILSAPSGDDNNQNSLNILGYENRSSNHGEKSLSDFMDLKILRSSFLKNRKPSNGFIAVTSSISSGDDSSTDGDFNSSPIRSAISAQLARSKVEKIKPIDVTIAETPSSLEHSAAYLQNLVTQRMQSTLASPISSGSEIATDRSLPKLCGSFPLSSGSPLNSCSGDIGSISANDNIIGSHADKAVLLSTSSKRRHRRKTHSATVLNTSGNENLECLNNISKSILVSVPAEISLSGLQAAVEVVSIDFEKDIKESTQQDDGVSQVIEPVPDSAVSTIAVEDSNCIAPSVEKISALLCHAMTPQKPSKKTKRANLKPALTSAGPSVPNEEPPEKSLVLLVTNVESIGPRESDDVESIKPRESDDISRIYVGPERESWVFRSPPSSAIKLVQHPSSDGESAKPTKKLFDMLKAASETKRNKYRDKLMNPSGVRQLFSSPIKTAPCSGLDGWHHLTNIKTLIDIETFLLQSMSTVTYNTAPYSFSYLLR